MDKLTIHANQLTSVSRPFADEGTITAAPPTSAELRARQRDSDVVVLSKVADVGARTANTELAPGDLPAGIFRGWLHLVFPDSTELDTKEFELVVLEHAPGEGIRTGRVYQLARMKIPVAWDALKRYPDFGDIGLMSLVNLVEVRALGLSLTISEEQSLDIRVANYLAHMAAIEAIPSAIDFWTNQIVSQTAVGSSEVHTFPDRIRANEEQLKRMLGQVAALRAEAEEVLDIGLGRGGAPMELIDGAEPITPSVEGLRPLYGDDQPSWVGATE